MQRAHGPSDDGVHATTASVRRPPLARARAWLLQALLVCFYVAIDALGEFANSSTLPGIPWQPHAALALAWVVVGGRAALLPMVAAVLAAGWLLRYGAEVVGPWLLAGGATAAAYGLAGLAIRRWTAWPKFATSVRDLTVFVAIVVVASIMAGAAQAGGFVLGGAMTAARLPQATLLLTTGELTAMVCFTPLLLLLASWPHQRPLRTTQRWRTALDSLAFVVLVTVILFVVFRLRPFDEQRMFYLHLLPVIALAMRYGVAGAAIAVPTVQLGLVIALSLTDAGSAFQFQLVMLAVGATALYVGALTAERDRSAAQAAEREAQLRDKAAALSEAQRTASTAELAAALAHDLNQPLSAIGTYARASRLLAERGPDGSARLLETLRLIEQESARAGQYVRRMRDFFRTGTLHLEPLSVRALIDNACAMLQDRLQRGGIEVQIDVATDVGKVVADAVQVGAVLGNLLGNACDALADTPGPRRIEIRAWRRGDGEVEGSGSGFVRIAIADTGPGVPEELRSQLFKPLETTKPHGMGLGLSLSRSIAERQGGRLWFDPQAPRTTFCLDLPAYS